MENKIENYFSIAFEIKERSTELSGLSVKLTKQLIAKEFNLVSNGDAVEREFDLMLETKFIRMGVSGVHPNPRLNEEFQKFKFEAGK